jgi:hypothetical protein
MSKSVFLYVHGDDYAALEFENNYNEQEVYTDMVAKGEKKRVLSGDDYYIEVDIKEFNGQVPADFLDFIMHDFSDYDDLKHSKIYYVA